jgi:hypothetical protein
VSAETDDASPDVDLTNSIELEAVSDEGGAESEVSATVGSTGALDKTLEDFAANDESRSTGFMGKNSEITWLQRLNRENKFGESSSIDLTRDAAKGVENGHHKSSSSTAPPIAAANFRSGNSILAICGLSAPAIKARRKDISWTLSFNTW